MRRAHKLKSQGFLIAVMIAAALILANALLQDHFVRIDLTEDSEYTLSDSTKKILKSLDDQVTVRLFFSQNVPQKLGYVLGQVDDLIDEFRIYGAGKITIERVDPDGSPENEQEAQMLGIPPLQLNVVERDKAEVRKIYLGLVMLYADKKEVLPVISEPSHLEYDLALSILRLTSPKIPRIGIMLPTDAALYAGLQEILSRQVELVKLEDDAQDVSQQGLDGLVVLAPRALKEAQTKEINSAFDAGISVLVTAGRVSVGRDLTAVSYDTGLEEFFKKLGLELSPSLVIDPQYSGRASFSSGALQYQVPYPFFVSVPHQGMNESHPVTSHLEGILLPWTSAIVTEGKSEFKYQPIATSSSASFLQDGDPQVSPQALQEMSILPGEKQTLATIVESADGKKKLALIGSTEFINDSFVNDYEANLVFFQNLIDWMSRGDDLIGIRSRGKTSRPLTTVSSDTASIIRWTHLIFAPFLIFAFGYALRKIHGRRLQQLKSRLE